MVDRTRDIQRYKPFIIEGAPTVYLPRPYDSRPNQKVCCRYAAIDAGKFTRNEGARPNKAHLSTQDVEQLRQFVKVVLPQEFTERRNPRLPAWLMGTFPFASHFCNGCRSCLRLPVVEQCRTKLQTTKKPAATSDSLVNAKNGPAFRGDQ